MFVMMTFCFTATFILINSWVFCLYNLHISRQNSSLILIVQCRKKRWLSQKKTHPGTLFTCLLLPRWGHFCRSVEVFAHLASVSAGRWWSFVFLPLCCGSPAHTAGRTTRSGSSGPSWAGASAAESCGGGCTAIQQWCDFIMSMFHSVLQMSVLHSEPTFIQLVGLDFWLIIIC